MIKLSSDPYRADWESRIRPSIKKADVQLSQQLLENQDYLISLELLGY